MRFYETGEADFFVDVPNKWELYCQYASDKKWSHRNMQSFSALNYYRDLEGSRMGNITVKELYLKNKPKNRINPWACLPFLYATGARYIKLEKAGPSGFKCAPFPMSCAEMRAKNEQLEREEKARRKQERFEKALLGACNKNSGKKSTTTKNKNKPLYKKPGEGIYQKVVFP